MPAISFEYKPSKYKESAMDNLGKCLMAMLRDAIHHGCPRKNHSYKVFVRGRPQGSITYHVPALEIVVRYHAEWEFTEDEVKAIGDHLAKAVHTRLADMNQPVNDVKIRFYKELGYQGFEV